MLRLKLCGTTMGLMLDQYKWEWQSGKSLSEILGRDLRAGRRPCPASACSMAVLAAHWDKRSLRCQYLKEKGVQA